MRGEDREIAFKSSLAYVDTGSFADELAHLLGAISLVHRDPEYDWPSLSLQTIQNLHFTRRLPR